MLEPHPSSQPKSQQSKQQSLQLNRLIEFIENKKSSSSQKLKEILLSKDCPLHKGPSHSQRPLPESISHDKSQRDTVAFNTKNIFVARNKTQSSSPRMLSQIQNKQYKIFITKEEILKLHEKEKSQYLPGGIKEKFNFNLIANPEQRHKSNLFPPLALPKAKRPVVFNKFEDQTTKWLNTQIKTLQEALSSSKDPNCLSAESNTLKNKEGQKQRIQQIQFHREKYNKSLQKLIEKAFRNKQKNSSAQKLKNIIEGIEGYDSKLIVHGQTYESEENRGQSVYASKGKLLSNPNLKIKKDTRFKSEKHHFGDKLTITVDSEQLPMTDAELKKIFDSEYKKRIIHTNREFDYSQSCLKLKTQVTAKPVDYLPSSIRTRSHKKALKLISQLESSIIKQQHEGEKSVKKIRLLQLAENTINQNQAYIQNALINEKKQKNQSDRLKRKRQSRKQKSKALLSNEKTKNTRNPAAKWQLAGYDWLQSTDEIQQNMQLQKYVQKIVKKSNPIPTQINQTKYEE